MRECDSFDGDHTLRRARHGQHLTTHPGRDPAARRRERRQLLEPLELDPEAEECRPEVPDAPERPVDGDPLQRPAGLRIRRQIEGLAPGKDDLDRLAGREGDVLRLTLPYGLIIGALVGLLTYAAAWQAGM